MPKKLDATGFLCITADHTLFQREGPSRTKSFLYKITSSVTQHGCLPTLLGDVNTGIEIVNGKEKIILYWAD
jgi:hypothetical protein